MSVFLYLSDWFYLSFSILSLYWIFRSSQNLSNQKIWNKILHQETAVVSACIFVFFLLVSMLDSVHIHQGYSMTLLDGLFYPLNVMMEYSYSEPCHINGFYPQLVANHDKLIEVYPHLQYVPKSIVTNAQLKQWIIQTIISISSFFLGGGLFLRFLFRNTWKSIPKYFRLSIITFISMIWLIVLLYVLSRTVHIFGTGQIGQDIFYQAVKSIRTGLFISSMTTLIIIPFALALGLSAGYFGGWIDDLVQFIYTVISSIPSVLLIGASLLSWQLFQEKFYPNWSASKQADIRLVVICILLGLTNWASLCRYIRAEVFKLREMNYVKAAKLLGSSSNFILRQHLLPNVMHLVIITVILDFSYYILAESVLTYIGIGVSPTTISWGNMINAARLELARTPVIWWPLVTAFIFMFTIVLVCNLLADAVRKALNPKEEIYTHQD